MSEKKGKIIDEKGKLFGKVNIIDLIVLLLIIGVAVVVALKLTGRGGALPGDAQASQIEYSVVVYRVAPEVYRAVEAEVAQGGEHTQLMANGAMLDGSEVLSVTSRPHMESVSMEDGSLTTSQEGAFVDAIFTIRATILNATTQEVGTQEVRIGKSHIVKTKTFELVNGIILDCKTVEPAA